MRQITAFLWLLLVISLVACARESEIFEVTVDENGCTYSGPTELTPGEYSIVLKNLSEKNQLMYLNRYKDGYTYQDFLALQSEPGEYIPKPTWADYPKMLSDTVSDDEHGGQVYTFIFDVEGETGIVVASSSPRRMFACGSFHVVENPE